MSESLFPNLPRRIKRRIDDAFNATYLKTSPNAASNLGGGGFIVDEPDTPLDAQIPLERIPDTLGKLNLPTDDEQILSVFRNAATGWNSSSLDGSGSSRAKGSSDSQLGVSLEDWRAVCAVLFEDYEPSDEGEDEGEDDPNEDAYQRSESELSTLTESEASNDDYNDSEDEYRPDGKSLKRKRGRPTRSSPSIRTSRTAKAAKAVLTPSSLSEDQKQSCLDTFGLFFPEVSSEDLPNQKIMIKDIQRVAKLLKERLKAEEIIEMLELFSSSPDKSMNYDDFTRMCIAANLL